MEGILATKGSACFIILVVRRVETLLSLAAAAASGPDEGSFSRHTRFAVPPESRSIDWNAHCLDER